MGKTEDSRPRQQDDRRKAVAWSEWAYGSEADMDVDTGALGGGWARLKVQASMAQDAASRQERGLEGFQ